MTDGHEPGDVTAAVAGGGRREPDGPSLYPPTFRRESPARPDLLSIVRVIGVDLVTRYGKPMPRRLFRASVNDELHRLGWSGYLTHDDLKQVMRPLLMAEQSYDRAGRASGLVLDLTENVERRRAFREEALRGRREAEGW